MIRFILNFFIYGFLFYVIWRFLPDTFETLVSWISSVFDFVQTVFGWVVERAQQIQS